MYALQDTDLALDAATARLREIEERLGESQELIEARQKVEEIHKRLQGLRAQQKDSEFAVQEIREKAAGVEKKLYGGAVRNPKELTDLQDDLNALNTQVRKREDNLLNILVEIEDTEDQRKESETYHATVEAGWRREQDDLAGEKTRLESERQGLEQKRGRQIVLLQPPALALYQILRERRGGRAVARVERGMCQGCRITLPTSVLQKARSGLALVQCVSCERILLVS